MNLVCYQMTLVVISGLIISEVVKLHTEVIQLEILVARCCDLNDTHMPTQPNYDMWCAVKCGDDMQQKLTRVKQKVSCRTY